MLLDAPKRPPCLRPALDTLCEGNILARRAARNSRALFAQEAADGVARLRALADPVLDAFGIELHGGGFLQRVVGSDDFHGTAIARAAVLDDDDAVKRLLLLTKPCKANCQHLERPP